MRRLPFGVVLCLAVTAMAQMPQYDGPAILSRGIGPVLQGGSDFVRLRPFLMVNGIYDSGMTPVSVDSQGRIPKDDVYGMEGVVGVYGYHTWRRSILGLDYRGNYRHYTQQTYYDGSDQSLTLGVAHQASRRVSISLREAAGTYARDFSGLISGGFYDPKFANIPSNELFDGRTYYLSSMADLTFQKSPRLSFNFGGTGIAVRRHAQHLIGVTGAMARGDVAYRVTRSSAIGFDYSYSHYAFASAFGSSDLHGLALDYAVLLGRNWNFALRGGIARIETLGLRRVAINPIIAAIIGQSTGVETFYQINYIPQADASLSRSFRRSTVSLSYNLGAGYGNGIYLTSRVQSASGGLSYTATRKWNLGLSGGYDTYTSLGQNIGRYQGYRGGGGVTYQITRAVHAVTRFDARQYEVTGLDYKRTTYRGTVGLAFSPGELPLSLW